MPEGSPTKKRKRERLDRKGQSEARHGKREDAARTERIDRHKRDIRNSGRRGGTGG